MSYGTCRQSVSRTVINQVLEVAAYGAWAYSGLTVTIPANCIFAVYAQNVWSSAQPDGIAIQFGSNASPDTRPFETCAMGNGVTSYGGYTPSGMTLYVYVKNNGLSANLVYLLGWYMPAS